MNLNKQKRLQAAGWRIGDAADFLALSVEEAALVDMRLALSRQLKQRRSASMTQAELARKLATSQPRVALAENGARSVSLDLLVRALLATGATRKDIARTIAKAA